MFATSDLVPLLAERGVVLSREQVYRLVAKVPERLSLSTLAALCDILGCTPTELIEPVRSAPKVAATASKPRAGVRDIRPRRAEISPDAKDVSSAGQGLIDRALVLQRVLSAVADVPAGLVGEAIDEVARNAAALAVLAR